MKKKIYGGRCESECIKTTTVFIDALMEFLSSRTGIHTQQPEASLAVWSVSPPLLAHALDQA